MNDKRERMTVQPASDADLAAVESAWRELPREAPPELLDRAVLNRARRDLETQPPRRLRWIGPFATAGVVVIAASLWLLQDSREASAPGDGALRLEPAADAAPATELRRSRAAPQAAPAQTAPEPKGAPENVRAASREAPGSAATADRFMAESAEASAEGVADGARDPDEWIERLLELKRQGRDEELKAELEAFRAAWPDHPLPPALREG